VNPLILASSSPRRLELLAQINITPSHVIPSHIDETPHKNEKPRLYTARIALEKAKAIAKDHKDSFILAADTIVTVGARILGKPENEDEARKFLNLLSGRNHRVYGGICLITPQDKIISKLVETRLKIKRLTQDEMNYYIQTNVWQDKAGGFAIQGNGAAFVEKIQGSYSNVMGLSLSETYKMLIGNGFKYGSI
jgi:septum formation protein